MWRRVKTLEQPGEHRASHCFWITDLLGVEAQALIYNLMVAFSTNIAAGFCTEVL